MCSITDAVTDAISRAGLARAKLPWSRLARAKLPWSRQRRSGRFPSLFPKLLRGNEGQRGQATIEAAILIPVIFLLLLLLIEPTILLYDRIVMNGAAADGCRLLATSTSADGVSDGQYKDAVLRHLGSIPQQDLFHVHGSGCTWDIQFEGNESTEYVAVTISTKVRPLPVVDFGSTLLGLVDGQGYLTQKVRVQMRTQDAWVVGNSLGMSPGAWVKGRE